MDFEPEGVRSGPSRSRQLLLLLPGWWTFRFVTGATWCFLDYVNLAFHEAGHLVFGVLGSTLGLLGGTLGQLLVPVLLAVRFRSRERDGYAAALCAWWTGESLVNVSIYMADARSLALPLVGGGDHDWNELFHRFGLLGESSVQTVSGATFAVGLVAMLGGLAWAASASR